MLTAAALEAARAAMTDDKIKHLLHACHDAPACFAFKREDVHALIELLGEARHDLREAEAKIDELTARIGALT